MKLKQFILSIYQSNCYVLYKNYEAMVIDPGSPVDEVIKFLESQGLVLKVIYATHGHIDHIGGINALKKRFSSAKVYAPLKDRYWYSKNPSTGLQEDLIVDQYVKENDIIAFQDLLFKVIETPGHSYGSTCLYYNEVLFSGDTLFNRSIGRTDLYLGSYKELERSIKNKLYTLPKNTVVYPGHGHMTTIKDEMEHNPFVRSSR